jgi:hypothetical protein
LRGRSTGLGIIRAQKVRAHNFIKQALLDMKEQMDSNTIIVVTSTIHSHKYIIQSKKQSTKKLQN